MWVEIALQPWCGGARCFSEAFFGPSSALFCHYQQFFPESMKSLGCGEKMLIQHQEKWVHFCLEMKPDAQIWESA